MATALNLTEKPQAETIHMLAGWRQWADAGSISSGLPRYLIDQLQARHIGTIADDGFYMFQFPGTHDLMRPVVKFEDGYPQELDTPSNDFYYAEVNGTGLVIFLGDEPQLNVERYIGTLLEAASELNVGKIIGFGGVYAEVPYNRERTISCTYSRRELKSQLQQLSVDFSNYNGGAAIGSILCRRAADRDMNYASFYALVPNYDLSQFKNFENTIRLENDFMAWLNVMRRVNHLLEIDFNVADLEDKTAHLIAVIDEKIDELESKSPASGVREYFDTLAEAFSEDEFGIDEDMYALDDMLDDDEDLDDPEADDEADAALDDVWEEELRRLLDNDDNQ